MATAVISPAINLQVPPEDVTAPNDHHLYDYEPKREETGDELSSAPSPFQNKKAKPFINIDDAYETETIPADAVATNEAPEPETAPNVVQPDEHDKALAGVVAPE